MQSAVQCRLSDLFLTVPLFVITVDKLFLYMNPCHQAVVFVTGPS